MRGLETRLRQLETGGGACPLCEEARAAILESIVAYKPGTAARHCGGCGRDVQLRIEEVDRLLELEGGGG